MHYNISVIDDNSTDTEYIVSLVTRRAQSGVHVTHILMGKKVSCVCSRRRSIMREPDAANQTSKWHSSRCHGYPDCFGLRCAWCPHTADRIFS